MMTTYSDAVLLNMVEGILTENVSCFVEVHVLMAVQTCPTAQDIDLVANDFMLRGLKIQTALEAQRDGVCCIR
jgi:hypothetical protein